jgi:2-methylcitrate dehydratase PrpD
MAVRNPQTTALAEFIVGTTARSLETGTVYAARRAFLDAIGCGLGGLHTPLLEALGRSFANQGVSGPGGVIGGQVSLPAPTAGLWNAVAINALDYDDTYEDGTNPIGHPGSSTVGATLAMASRLQGLTLGDVLATVAVGYETAIRVALASQPSQERRDFVWGLGPHQAFGAAAVASRSLGLSVQETITCLGHTGVHTSVPSVWTAAGWLKDAVGWPTMTGIEAAHLSRAGFHGPSRIFDGRRSYYATVASDRFRPHLLLDDLGTKWRLATLSFKPYPACRWIHSTLDALAEIVERERIRAGDIERVDVAGFWELEKLFLRYEPEDLIDAQFSLPYTCAQVLRGTAIGAAWFDPSELRDPEVLALAARVHVTTDPGVEAERQVDPAILRSRVSVELKDGRRFDLRRDIAHGHADDPLTDDELRAKFERLATKQLGVAGARSLAIALLDGPLEAAADATLAPVLEPASVAA